MFSLFLSFLAHRLLFSCRSEFISNQNAIDKHPILITSLFAYLHINDCRLCCFSAAAAPSHCYCSPHAATPCLPLSSRLHTCSLQLTFKGRHFIISTIKGNRLIVWFGIKIKCISISTNLSNQDTDFFFLLSFLQRSTQYA